MAEVVPHTSIRLMFDVPLTSDYINTYWFSNRTQQQTYFNTFEYYLVSDQSYQRKSRGWLRIMAPYNSVYNANYLMFRNISPTIDGDFPTVDYEEKWYYAFVDDVVYINERTAEIHYSIDVIQTYMFDWTFHDCFIERECTASDNLYEHLIDEGLPVPDYVNSHFEEIKFYAGTTATTLSAGYVPIIAATVNLAYQDTTDGGVITQQKAGIIQGCNLLYFADLASAVSWLQQLPGEKQDAILGIYLVPTAIAYAGEVNGRVINAQALTKYIFSLGDYQPVNRKLLSYPYNSAWIISSDGSQLVLDYKKIPAAPLSVNQFIPKIRFAYTAPIQGYFALDEYNGDDSENTTLLPLPPIPTCTWSNDTYKAWAALNTGYMISSIAGSVVDLGARVIGAVAGAGISGAVGTAVSGTVLSNETALSVGGSIGNDPSTLGWVGETSGQAFSRNARNVARGLGQQQGGIIGDIQNIANNLIAQHNAKIAPDSFNGSAANLAKMANHLYGFFYAQHHIREDYAAAYDKYFTMFGYKVNRVGKPSLHNRTRFTYVKTTNCEIDGPIPNIERELICAIFNKGVRFWAVENTVQFGDYTLANDVIPGPTP